MAEARHPQVYSIAAHRGFADALVSGLIPRYGERELGLARLTLLLPSRRAARTITEAFVRQSGGGLLLPRMAVVGDLDLDETLGPLLDPLGAGTEIPAAADPVRRWLRLAGILAQVRGDGAPASAMLLRQALEIGRTMDRLLIEQIAPEDLLSERVVGIVGELASHWRANTREFLEVQAHWLSELAARNEVDAATRRNLLFEYAARRWVDEPPPHPVVVAGVTSASPPLARLLRVVSELPKAAVILPDLDLSLDPETWDALGHAGHPPEPGAPPIGRDDAMTHPQYHLKVLLNRMAVGRDEVRAWHRSGPVAAEPARSRAISNLFLPPRQSAVWAGLLPAQRRLSGVRLMTCAHPEEEARAIAILVREAIETPERRVALITPDRGLAARVVAQLKRWDIDVDDTAGQPLSQSAAGRVLLGLAEVVAEAAAPVSLVALLTHPLVAVGEARAGWLDSARALDRALRGPRPPGGLAALGRLAAKAGIAEWWHTVEGMLAPAMAMGEQCRLSDTLATLAQVAEALCGPSLWEGADGNALSAFVADLRAAAVEVETVLDMRELPAVLRDAMDRIAVRAPWGGHPRFAIYGLLEGRMSRADLMICGGLVEGVWPARSTPEPLLPPAVMRALGVPGADFRIGLAAHDLASALGAPEVVLSHSERDSGAPTIPSRFILRVRAMLGDQLERHTETRAVDLARLIDAAPRSPDYPRPEPDPAPEQRHVPIAVTGLDRLRGDPYQFYASDILGLRSLDPLDAEPSAAWKGTAVHEILDAWHRQGNASGALHAIAERALDEMSAHPLMRGLWRPRLLAALDWIDREVSTLADSGRRVLVSERPGAFEHRGVRIHGRVDRIDRMPDGSLGIVDYKTGSPPRKRMVAEGFALQLGLIGLIAAAGGIEGASGEAAVFEYWSLARDKSRGDPPGFGYRESPIKPGNGDEAEAASFLALTRRFLDDALDRWILGREPFTARLNPDLAVYADYDQLMRLDEWYGSMLRGAEPSS